MICDGNRAQLQCRLRVLLDEMLAQYRDLLLHVNSHWLSAVKCHQTFVSSKIRNLRFVKDNWKVLENVNKVYKKTSKIMPPNFVCP